MAVVSTVIMLVVGTYALNSLGNLEEHINRTRQARVAQVLTTAPVAAGFTNTSTSPDGTTCSESSLICWHHKGETVQVYTQIEQMLLNHGFAYDRDLRERLSWMLGDLDGPAEYAVPDTMQAVSTPTGVHGTCTPAYPFGRQCGSYFRKDHASVMVIVWPKLALGQPKAKPGSTRRDIVADGNEVIILPLDAPARFGATLPLYAFERATVALTNKQPQF